MQMVFCKVTARRTNNGLVTTSRKIIGPCRESPENQLDRLAEILGLAILNEMRSTGYLSANISEKVVIK